MFLQTDAKCNLKRAVPFHVPVSRALRLHRRAALTRTFVTVPNDGSWRLGGKSVGRSP
jgi:hypothetical protein